MIDIQLAPVANQQLTAQLDGVRYDITLKETRGCMSTTITADGVTLVSMSRVVAGTPLLPYPYQAKGNFVLLTEGDELPYFTAFGSTQTLVYVSPAEIEQLRGA